MNGRQPVPTELRVALTAAIRDVPSWPAWVPGVRLAQGLGPTWRLAFGGPRPFRCVCRVREVDGGVAIDLEEGGPPGLSGTLAVVGDQLVWTLDLQPGLGLPDVLWRTLEREVVPAALRALGERAARRTPVGSPAAAERTDPAYG